MRTKIIAGNLITVLVIGLVSYFLVSGQIEAAFLTEVDGRVASDQALLTQGWRLTGHELVHTAQELAAEPATHDLCQALRDADRVVRSSAGSALVRLGKPAVPALVALIEDSDDLVRRQVIDCLRDIGPDASDAYPGLVAIVRDPRDPLRGRAVAALGALGPPATPARATLLLSPALRADAVAALARLGPEAAPARQALTGALK